MPTDPEQPGRRGLPGRPPAFERDDALWTLAVLFWEKGYDQTSYDDMRRRTGLSASSLQNAFGNKQAIFVAALQRYRESGGERPGGVLVNGERGLDDIRVFFDDTEHYLARDDVPRGCLVVNTMAEVAAADPAVLDQIRAYRGWFEAAFGAALLRAVRRGEISGESVGSRAAMLFSVLCGVLLVVKAEGSVGAAGDILDGVRDTLDAWRDEPAADS